MSYNKFELFLKFIHDEGYVTPQSMGVYKTDKAIVIPPNTYGISVCINGLDNRRLSAGTILRRAIHDKSFLLLVSPVGAVDSGNYRNANIVYDSASNEFTKCRYFDYTDLTNKFRRILDRYNMMQELVK